MAQSAPTDEELQQRWLTERDEAAFAEIERRHSPAMLGFAVWQLRRWGVRDPDSVALESVQETFLRLAVERKQLPHVRNWLFRVLRQRVADAARREGRQPIPLPVQVPEDDGPQLAEPEDPGLGPLEAILDEPHLLGALLECVRALPAHLRELVEMHYLKGMSYDQIAEETGLTKSQIASRLNRARQRIKDCYTRRLSGAK